MAHSSEWASFFHPKAFSRLLALFAAAWLFGCASAPKLEVYFVSEGVFQYYVHSTDLAGSKVKGEMDFTWRNADPEKDAATCNFSLIPAGKVPRSVSDASFVIDRDRRLVLQEIKILFVEKGTNTIRVSTKMAFEDFSALMQASSIRFEVTAEGTSYVLQPSKDFYAALHEAAVEIID